MISTESNNMNIFYNQKHKAFTLAEVLITLGIIGVIAALTIPTLIQQKQKQETVTKLQKVYTTLVQAVTSSEAENGNSAEWDWGDNITTTESFDTYWAPYLKIIKYCDNYSICGYKTNSDLLSIQNESRFVVVDNHGRTVMLADGTLFKTLYSGTVKAIFVDINGPQGPNKYNRDVFRFSLDKNKHLMPYGYNHAESTIQDDCSKTGIGYACSFKIMNDNWQIKDDYPW